MVRIKNAIILAAGRGSRMKELTNDKPKCMQIINNKSVIQRTIEVLKYKNIKNIIVVTGYKSNILKRHLNNLFNDIIYIENDRWNETNSIYSMYLATAYLQNSIVIDSDIYINNVDSIKSYIRHSGYSAKRCIDSFEWQLLSDKKNNIIDVKKQGYFEDGLPIIDVSYWTKYDAKIIIFQIKKSLNDRNNLQRYWDEIPLFDLQKELHLKRYDVNVNDLLEYDNEEELKEIRRIIK